MRLVGSSGCRGKTRSLINVDRPAVRHQCRERDLANNSLSSACEAVSGKYAGDMEHERSVGLDFDDRCGGRSANAGARDPLVLMLLLRAMPAEFEITQLTAQQIGVPTPARGKFIVGQAIGLFLLGFDLALTVSPWRDQ